MFIGYVENHIARSCIQTALSKHKACNSKLVRRKRQHALLKQSTDAESSPDCCGE